MGPVIASIINGSGISPVTARLLHTAARLTDGNTRHVGSDVREPADAVSRCRAE